MKYIRLVLLLFPILIFGQNAPWKNYTTSTTINAIAHSDSDIWIATDGGVTRYNTLTGVANFFNRANADLPYNDFTSIAVDQNGTRWLGTFVGLFKWEGDDITPVTPNQYIQIRKLGVDNNGTVWMHTEYSEIPLASYHPTVGWKTYDINTLVGQGENLIDIRVNPLLSGVYFTTRKSHISHFHHFDGGNLTTTEVPADPNAPSQTLEVFTWEIDSEGHFWFINDNKLFRKTAEDWEVETTPIWADEMAIDMYGKIWLAGSYLTKFYRRESSEQYTEINVNSTTLASGFQLSFSPANELWILNAGALLKRDNQVLVPIKTRAFDMPNNRVVKLMVTGQQKIWGAFESGSFLNSNSETAISTFENQTWQFDTIQGSPNRPRDLEKDVNERVLVANWSDLSIFDGTWKKINAVNYPYDPILSVACQPGTDQVWVGGFDYIGKIENDTYQQINLPEGGSAERMAVDQNGRVWIMHFDSGTNTIGLAYYVESEWHIVPFSDLAFNTDLDILRDIAIAPDGRLFVIGIQDVVYFDGISWKNVQMPPYDGEFEAIAFDGPDHFWVATTSVNCYDIPIPEFGLLESDNGIIRHYKFKDYPLPHSNIRTLTVDGYHNVWMGCSAGGIAVYNANGVIVGTKSIPALSNKIPAIAYPNPTDGNISLEFDVLEPSDVHLRIFNQLGQQVAERTLEQATPDHFQWVLEKSKIGTGCFFWSITTKMGEQTGKIIFLD